MFQVKRFVIFLYVLMFIHLWCRETAIMLYVLDTTK